MVTNVDANSTPDNSLINSVRVNIGFDQCLLFFEWNG